MRRLAFLVGVLGWFVAGTGVAAAAASGPTPALLNPDGTGSVFAPTNTPDWSWQACTGSGPVTCTAFANGSMIDVGDPAAGTSFVGTAPGAPSVTSPVWEGTLQVDTPPAVVGAVRANRLVMPSPAVWSGGWSGDFARPQLAACARPNGTECTSLTDPNFVPQLSCPQGGAVIDPAFTGWYLRVADHLYPPGVAFVVPLHSSPYGAPVWPAGPLTAVAMLGRIAPASGPRTNQCGAGPLPPGPSRAGPGWCGRAGTTCTTAAVSARGTVSVWCLPIHCTVSITARRLGVTVSYGTTVGFGFAQLRLPARVRVHRRRARARVRVTVYVNGRRRAAREVTL